MTDQEKNQQAREEEKKRFLLKSGVWIFSVFILVFWVFTLTRSFNNKAGAGETIDADAAAWQSDLNQTIATIKNVMNDKTPESSDTLAAGRDFLEKMDASLEKKAAASGTPILEEKNIADESSATMTPEELLSGLQQRLPELASSSCPEFIDCMPTIGEAKPCVIPPGCENITQIAY